MKHGACIQRVRICLSICPRHRTGVLWRHRTSCGPVLCSARQSFRLAKDFRAQRTPQDERFFAGPASCEASALFIVRFKLDSLTAISASGAPFTLRLGMVIDPAPLPGIVLEGLRHHDGQFLSWNIDIFLPIDHRIFGASPDAAARRNMRMSLVVRFDHGFQNARRGWLRICRSKLQAGDGPRCGESGLLRICMVRVTKGEIPENKRTPSANRNSVQTQSMGELFWKIANVVELACCSSLLVD